MYLSVNNHLSKFKASIVGLKLPEIKENYEMAYTETLFYIT